jgi:GTPase SAR1 family protein
MNDALKRREDLFDTGAFPNNVSILIGENGCGKSTMLNNLCHYFLDNKKHVVAIANSIYDKFDARSRNLKILRGRSGRGQSKLVMKSALVNIAKSDVYTLKNVTRALEYVGFDSVMGFRINKLADDFDLLLMNSSFKLHEKREIIALINSYLHESEDVFPLNRDSDAGNIIWLEEGSLYYRLYDKYSLTQLFLNEEKLKEYKVIDNIEIFLRKNGAPISMLSASSVSYH